MFVWAKIPERWLNRMTTMDFGMLLLDQGDVAVSPGSGFGPAGEGYLRLALVENENRLRQAVRQIGRCLEREERRVSSMKGSIGRRSCRYRLVQRTSKGRWETPQITGTSGAIDGPPAPFARRHLAHPARLTYNVCLIGKKGRALVRRNKDPSGIGCPNDESRLSARRPTAVFSCIGKSNDASLVRHRRPV